MQFTQYKNATQQMIHRYSTAGNMRKLIFFLFVCILQTNLFAQTSLQKIEFVSFSQVNITDQFWKPKIDKVATKTLAACIYQTEVATPRIRNFSKHNNLP